MIGLILATGREAAPFLARAGIQQGGQAGEPPAPACYDLRPARAMVICICGMGPARARAGAELLLQKYGAAVVVNAGVAGAVSERLGVAAICRVSAACLWPAEKIMHACGVDRWTELPGAVLATVEQPVFDPVRRAAIARHADIVDMEGAAIAQCCQARGVPCYAVKGVTDLAGTNGRQRLLQNLDTVSEALAERTWGELELMSAGAQPLK
ncbi:MAG: hypothetical protein WCI17_04960 [bacterium]